MKKYYIVYQITNLLDLKIYIGAHGTDNLDDNYFGSSKYLSEDIKKLGKSNFRKDILFIFDNKEDMLEKEKEIINIDFINREDTYNKMPGGFIGSFFLSGLTPVKGTNDNIIMVSINDPRFLSGELVSIFKNTIPIIDKNGKNFRIDKNDTRFLSGELKHNCTGKLIVKDKEGNFFQVENNDSRFLSGELISIFKGRITVKDKEGNFFSVYKDDPRYLSGELVFNMTGMVTVKDKEGNRQTISNKDPRYLSGELISIYKGREGIKGMQGKKVSDDTKSILREKAKLRTGNKSSGYGKSFMNNGQKTKRIEKNMIDQYIQNGWVLGRLKFKNK